MSVLHDKNGNPYGIGSARRYEEVTPHDTNTIDEFKGIYVGATGDVKIGNSDDDAVVFTDVPTGTIIPVYGNRVYSTDTTATDLVALRD